MLFSPYLPLLFMGEEYGETRPFPFFCSFSGRELVQAVREGRKKEFAAFVSDSAEIPDPDAKKTFESARLSWSWPEGSQQAGLRRLYRDLLAARRNWPRCSDFSNRAATLHPNNNGGGVVELIRGSETANAPEAVRIFFNLTGQQLPLPANPPTGSAVVFTSESGRYGGNNDQPAANAPLEPYESRAYGPRQTVS